MMSDAPKGPGKHAWFGMGLATLAVYGLLAAALLALLPGGGTPPELMAKVFIIGAGLAALTAILRVFHFYNQSKWLDLATRCMTAATAVITIGVSACVLF